MSHFMKSLTSYAKFLRPRSAHQARIALLLTFAMVASALSIYGLIVRADNTAQTLPFSQNWTNAGLITANDNWTGVPGIEGYLGQDITTATGTDPQTLLTTSAVANDLDVVANQSNPNTLTSGGVAEFDGIANPTIALQGSGTADAPYVLIHVNASGLTDINVAYNLRDIDGSTDNAVQPVALQYRVGNSGNFTNIPAGFVADATTGPSLATLVTPVSVTLPAAANNQPLVQVRIITTNAVGNDEWVGIDDISVTGTMTGLPTNPTGTGLANPNTIVAGNSTLLTVSVNPGANPTSTGLAVTADLTSIGGSASQTFFDNGTNGDVTSGDNIFSFNAAVPANTTAGGKTLPFSITDAQTRSGSGSISLTIQAPPPPSDHVVISQIYGGGGNASATYQNDYVELYNPSSMTFNLNGWSVQYASSTSSFGAPSTITPLAGSIAPGEYYLVKLASGGAVGQALPAANVEGATNISATVGKIALVNNSEALADGSSPCTLGDPNLVDFVGFGAAANCREGSANAPGGSNTSAILRNSNGAADTNQNLADFTAGAPNPRRTAIIVDAPPFVSSTDTDADAFASTPAPRDASIAVFFSEPVEVIGTWYSLTCASTGAHTTVAAAGPQNWVITPDVNFMPGEQCTFQIFAANVKDADTDDSVPNTDFMQADYTTNFTVTTDVPAPYDPSVHLTMGNPSGAVTDINQPNNYLLLKPELAISYNRDRGGPNWVSWHLSDDWTGSLTRVDTFRPDPQLPAAWNRVNQFDYSGSGFDRGHMTPSADRLASLPLNQATFLMDNIIPQAPDNNQGTWNNMEQALRTYTPANELYIISGGAGIGGSGDNGPANTIAGGRITVPASTWKVVLVIPKGENDIARVNCSARTIAVIVPNTNGTNTDWTTYLTTVDAVETLTGYDFFSNLPEPIQRCVEAGINGNNPPLDTDADGVPDSTDNCPFAANANQANFDGDTLGDACDPDDDNDGVLDGDDQCPNTPPNTPVNATGCSGISAPCPMISAVAGMAIMPVTLTGTGGTGSPYTFSATGLPSGLMISAGGTISGTPTVSGTFPYTVTVRDKDLNPGTVNCSVTVACPMIAVTPTAVPSGTAGTAYGPVQFSQTGSGAAITWSVSSNNLPAGLALNPSTGVLSGTPTVAVGVNVTIRATDSGNCFGEVTVTLQISCPTIIVMVPGTNTATATMPFSQMFTQTGGTGTTNFTTASMLPAGLSLAANGTLSGIPTRTGTFPITVKATDSNNCMGTVSYTLTVNCQTITVHPSDSTLPEGMAGTAYQQFFTQVNGVGQTNFSISAGALPMGEMISQSGILSGVPTEFGNFSFTVRATDINGCFGERAYTLVIIPPCPTITVTPDTVPNAFVGTPYNATLTAQGGMAPYSFTRSSGGIPAGLTLSSTGTLSGTPTSMGIYGFSVKATDANNCAGYHDYTIIVSGDGLVFYPLSRPVRLLDTRPNAGNCDNVGTPIAGGSSLTTLAHTTCESIQIPSNAKAIVGNLTVLNQTNQSGYLTIYPDGQTTPLAANMIYEPGGILSNNFTVGLSNDGKFNVFGERTIDVVVDVSGYYAPPTTGGLYYHPLSKPIRLLDTRANQGNCDNVSTPIGAGTSITTQGRTTCEGLTIPSTAQAIVGNATVINSSGQVGYLTIYPNGVPVPLAANMIYFPGQILSNAFTVGLNASGEFNIFGERQIDMVVDVAGYYSSEALDENGTGLLFKPLPRPLRVLDTRAGSGNCDAVSTPISGGNSIATAGWLTCETITIPSSARTLLGNVTVINQTGTAGYLTLYPDGVTQPLVANMVYLPNQILSNAFVVRLNLGTGQFRIFAERTLDAAVDVSGFFEP
jgi:DNA/RNA endonuclease G (NUC1)